MRTNLEFNIKISIIPKYNLLDKKLLKNPFVGELGETYKTAALLLVSEELKNGRTRGTIELEKLKDAIDSTYIHSVDLELEAYFSVE